MTVKRRKETKLPHVVQHRIADIRGGVSVASAELGGDYLKEGAIVSAPEDGVCHVVKFAVVYAAASSTDTEIAVAKYSNIAAGDYVMLDGGDTTVVVSAVDTSSSTLYDTLTLASALGEDLEAGAYIVGAASDGTAALAYTPFAVVGTGKPIVSGVNIDTDAWVFAVTRNNPLPTVIADELKGVINY